MLPTVKESVKVVAIDGGDVRRSSGAGQLLEMAGKFPQTIAFCQALVEPNSSRLFQTIVSEMHAFISKESVKEGTVKTYNPRRKARFFSWRCTEKAAFVDEFKTEFEACFQEHGSKKSSCALTCYESILVKKVRNSDIGAFEEKEAGGGQDHDWDSVRRKMELLKLCELITLHEAIEYFLKEDTLGYLEAFPSKSGSKKEKSYSVYSIAAEEYTKGHKVLIGCIEWLTVYSPTVIELYNSSVLIVDRRSLTWS
jgi:hypothetical protein